MVKTGDVLTWEGVRFNVSDVRDYTHDRYLSTVCNGCDNGLVSFPVAEVSNAQERGVWCADCLKIVQASQR